jgi:hypothetical protein
MPSKKQPGTPISPSRTEKKPVASIKRSPQEANPATKKQQLIDLLSGAKPVAAGHPQKPVRILDFMIHLSCRDLEAGRWNIDRFSDFRSTLSG